MSVIYTPEGEELCACCRAPKKDWVQKNHSVSYPPDYDWYCGVCGNFVRISSN